MKKVIFGGALTLGLILTSCGGSEIEKIGDEMCACYDNDTRDEAMKCMRDLGQKNKDLLLNEDKQTDAQKEEIKALKEKTSKCAEEANKKFSKGE